MEQVGDYAGISLQSIQVYLLLLLLSTLRVGSFLLSLLFWIAYGSFTRKLFFHLG